MSTFQHAHGRPENGAATVLRHSITPFTSTSPIAAERMREVGVFWISRLSRRSRKPPAKNAGPTIALTAASTESWSILTATPARAADPPPAPGRATPRG
jgi:hypothetical protein